MRITSVVTKVGDRGTTRLVGGAEVNKDDVRIEAYGTIDELNATLGLVRVALRDVNAPPADRQNLDDLLAELQHDLFDLGADLATPPDARWEGMHLTSDEDIARLEAHLERLNAPLPPLKEFILPGGGPVGAALHLSRTVCRRAERRIVTLVRAEPETGAKVVVYVNRLSDLLFIAGRWVAQVLGETEVHWKRRS